ncbi:cytochrome P450 4C1-like isoform X2 [Lycorma delicatula]|uniref:cytochrome P450 4C1-like isoform X2 n=1 Tax=Lycorma delicatula TaxID=130591 RepID=UPI003F51AA36
MILLLFLIILTLLFIIHKRKINRMEKFASKIPGPTGLPLVGNTFSLVGKTDYEVLKTLMACLKEYKEEKLLKFWFVNRLFISSADPDVVQVLASKTKNKGDFMNALHLLFKGIVFISGPEWKNQKRFVNKLFLPHLYENYISIFNDKSRIMVEKLMETTPSGSFDISHPVMCCSLDTICCAAMGVDIDAVRRGDNSPLHNAAIAAEIIVKRIFRPWLWPDFIFYMTKKGKNFSKADSQFKSFIQSIINKRRNIRTKERNNKEDNNDKNGINNEIEINEKLTYMDMKIDYAEKNNISDGQLLFEFDIVVAGSDTVAALISFTLLMLAMHTEWQEKLHNELDELYGDSDQNVTMNEINKMEILDYVVKESLRLCSVPHTVRLIEQDTVMGEYTIPSGTTLYIPSYCFHHDSQYWSHPNEFHPEHFLPEVVAKRPKNSFIPFHPGPRQCPDFGHF